MIFTRRDYATLHEIVFQPDYPGYRPDRFEAPNRDGVLDKGKRYAHVSMRDYRGHKHSTFLAQYLAYANAHARLVAEDLGIPREWWPCPTASVIRVLEYAPGAGSVEHTDSTITTNLLYRSDVSKLKTPSGPNSSTHFGRIAEMVMPGIVATPHSVEPSDVPQYSIVYAGLPKLDLVLPSGETVGEWLKSELAQSVVKEAA